MLWQLALISVLVPTAYWGVVYLRRRPFGSATAGAMMLATAGAAALALLAGDAGWAEPVGAVALGAGVVQLAVGPALRSLTRWAIGADRLRLAAVLVELRDVVTPGTGGRDDRRMVAALRDVKEGRVDEAVAALVAVRERAPAVAHPAIDERITLLYLSAQRWADAVAWSARTLLAGASMRPLPPDLDERFVRLAGALRALGASPPLAVELVGAQLRVGEFDAAAELAERFLAVAGELPELAQLSYRLHLIVLAHHGRVAAVDRLVDPSAAGHVSPAARRYWAALARLSAGDDDGARLCLAEARALARGDRRARALIDDATTLLDRPRPSPTPRSVAVADRLAAALPPPPPRAPGRRAAVTVALIGANLVVAAVCGLWLAGPGDLGSVVRAGANVRTAVDSGEWWRLASSVFVHVGLVHLAVNVLALWSLGRLVEGLYGGARMLCIYLAAGLGGALASHGFASAGVSAGASGAVFGLLGAALVELGVHRGRYRPQWRRSVFGALVVVTLVQLALGFGWSIIDQAAHLGGLVAGAALGALLSPGWRWSSRRGVAVAAQLGAVAATVGFAAALLATAVTGYDATLGREPTARRVVARFAVDAPTGWEVTGEQLRDDGPFVVLQLVDAGAPQLVGDELARWEQQARRDRAGFDRLERAHERHVPLPAGWQGSEWHGTVRDPLGSTQRFRVVLFAGVVGGAGLVGALYAPELLTAEAGAGFGAVLASVRAAE